MTETIEGEAVEVGTDLAVYAPPSPTLFHTDDPAEVVARATRTAEPLAAVVRKQNLAVTISGREHVRVEGWTLLGSMLGVFPVCVWSRKLDNGWEARVEARTIGGAVVGAAEAECLRSESLWSSRDDYALRSMAQTRATSKALRQPLGFVMQLAGFEATPAEEMPANGTDGEDFKDAEPLSADGFVWPFGKHKGATLAQTPVSYVSWYSDQGTQQNIRELCSAFLQGPSPDESDDGIPF